MRVLIVSVAPLFREAVHGGSQRILTQIATGLADAGNDVRIVCGARPENEDGFQMAGRIPVEPALRLGPFPAPYETSPHLIAESAAALSGHLDWADRLYLHADIFHFRPLLPAGMSVIRSFHDFHYETALVSAFAYGADLTIVPSDYLKRCIEASVGRSRHPLEPIRVIPNGVDLAMYKPVRGSVPAGVRPKRKHELVMLHPHRPDLRKGITQALDILAAVAERTGGKAVRLLVPRHIDVASSDAVRSYYANVSALATERGVSESVEFVDWQSSSAMPQLYSFADVTLCPGNFIESFGLTAYESLACGTPCVAARVGAFRDGPRANDFHLVEYGDTRAAAEAVLGSAEGMSDESGARALLAARFDAPAMVSGYVDAITGALPKATTTGDRCTARDERGLGLVALAPWCHLAGPRIYNDYAYRHLELPDVARAFAERPGWRRQELAAEVPKLELDQAIETGTLITVDSAAV